MRLTEKQIRKTIEALENCFGVDSDIWLFGSRIDDNKHGGDVDFYIETGLKEKIVSARIEFILALWHIFGDQKIDVVLRRKDKSPSPFHMLAKETGIMLRKAKNK